MTNRRQARLIPAVLLPDSRTRLLPLLDAESSPATGRRRSLTAATPTNPQDKTQIEGWHTILASTLYPPRRLSHADQDLDAATPFKRPTRHLKGPGV